MLFNFDLSTVYAKRASNNRPQGVSWKTKVKSVFGKLGKCCFYLQHFLNNIDNDKSKQKYTQSHSSYKIETSNF